jgi:hypothetical protein
LKRKQSNYAKAGGTGDPNGLLCTGVWRIEAMLQQDGRSKVPERKRALEGGCMLEREGVKKS